MIFLVFLGLFLKLSAEVLTADDIQKIYDEYVHVNFTPEYAHRYTSLPIYKNTTPWKWEGKDFPRVIALLEFERFVEMSSLRSQNGLAINGIDPEWHYLPHQSIDHISYDEDPIKYDLHALRLDRSDYDFVMLNQTLEHLYDPIRCLKNIYSHMRKGGIIYINVPTNSILHSQPYHYYTGYTPVGLGVVLKAAGFEILSIGQWGNLEYLTRMQNTYSWPSYDQLNDPGYNDVKHPVITWIFATKNPSSNI